jgi:thiol-disulfide isomerase/thioredoxin
MKKMFHLLAVLWSAATFAQPPGYEIKVTFKPFKNQYIYLGHYFGKQYPIIDSARLDANSQAVFRGTKNLQGGIYLIGYPNKAGFFEVLIDKQQRFSIIADTATIRKGVSFLNSPDNTLFNDYQQYMIARGTAISLGRQQLSQAKTAADSARITKELMMNDSLVRQYRHNLIKKDPKNILSVLMIAMREPEIPAQWKKPSNRQDSLNAYRYFKNHFWDGVEFWDGRLAYTTFFEDKVDKYFNEIVVPHPDSVIREIDHMMGFAVINDEMTRFLLLKFLNRYLNQKYMWEDAVFVHLFEKYFAQKDYSWLTKEGRKTITDRAYSLMANIMGSPASDIALPDSNGITRSLYGDTTAKYTIVSFWDPTCGHCKEVLPKLDSMYRTKWKASGLKIYSVAKETDGTRNDWLNFIRNNKLEGWTHVYYSKAEEKQRIDAGIPGYSQLFDIQSFPTLYLLDKDKRIVAKKLSWEQTDEVLQVKIKGE